MENPNKLPECHTCLYFKHIEKAIGICHLNPPTPLTDTSKAKTVPLSEPTVTWETNYCSHHTAK